MYVQPCITGPYYFPGPQLPNRHDILVNWGDTDPEAIYLILNGKSVRVSPSSPFYTYDFGRELKYSLLGTRNVLQAYAVGRVDGQRLVSNNFYLYPIGIAFPSWLLPPTIPLNLLRINCISGGGSASFGLEYVYPEEPVEARVTFPSWFPYIGGQRFGLGKTQAKFNLEVDTSGTGVVSLTGSTGFEAAGQEVIGSLQGAGQVRIPQGQGVSVLGASLGIALEGNVEKKAGIADVIPALKALENTWLIGRIIRWFNTRAQLEAKISPSVNTTLQFEGRRDGWHWQGVSGGGKIKTELALVINLIKAMKARVYGGGAGGVELQVPPAPSYLKRIYMQLYAGLQLIVWRWRYSLSKAYTWSYPFLLATRVETLSAPPSLGTQGWRPIPRDYAASPETYAVFQGNRTPLRLGTRLGSGLPPTQENLIVSNVFPYGDPALAANGDLMLLWVHDDTEKPLMQGEEIYFSVYRNGTWTPPHGITDDTLQDFAPQVAFDARNQAVAVWERNVVEHDENTQLDQAYVDAFEIAYSVWNGTQWSEPTLLTDNDILDYAPFLTRGHDGRLLLIWRQNTHGELLGTAEAPETILYTVWDGSSWSTPKALLQEAIGIIDLTAARWNEQRMIVVYSQDLDGDLLTPNDQELFAMTWDGSRWSTPVRLTQDNLPDNRPQVIYDRDGRINLLWLKGDTLVGLLGQLTGTPHEIAVEGAAGVLDFRITQDSRGNLALLWQGLSNEGVDIFYAAFDQANAVFSNVRQLTHDPSAESLFAPASSRQGEMVVAYYKTHLITETVTVTDTVTIPDVTTFGSTDLYVLRHTFGPDLALQDTDIALFPVNPAPGSTAQITVTLRNEGDWAVPSPRVAFYQGDPRRGGRLLGTVEAPVVLTGGMTTTLTFAWDLPTSGAPFTLFVVADPENQIAEWNEENNTATAALSLPDVQVSSLTVEYGPGPVVTASVTITNGGVADAGAFEVALRLEDPEKATGEIGRAQVSGLKVNDSTRLEIPINVATLPEGRHLLYAVADVTSAIREADETNNTAFVGLGVLPDLRVTSVEVDRSRGTVRIGVKNGGPRDAVDVIVGLYLSLPRGDNQPLAASTVRIPADEEVLVTLRPSLIPQGFYVGAGIQRELEDRNPADNIVLIGPRPKRFFLPKIN